MKVAIVRGGGGGGCGHAAPVSSHAVSTHTVTHCNVMKVAIVRGGGGGGAVVMQPQLALIL